MKKLIILSFLIFVFNQSLFSQHKLYKSNGEEKEYERVFNSITFESRLGKGRLDPIQPSKAIGAAIPILAIAGAVTNWGIKFASGLIDQKKEKYKSELTSSSYNLDAQLGLIPVIKISRFAYENKDDTTADTILYFELLPKNYKLAGDSITKFFYYELDGLNLKYSDAKINSKHPDIDFTIEVEILGADKKGVQTSHNAGIFSILYNSTEESKPIKVQPYSITMPREISIMAIKMKITETNSDEVKYDKFISSFLSSGEELGNIFTVISESIPESDAENKK